MRRERLQGENWRWGAKGGGKQLIFGGSPRFLMQSKGKRWDDGQVTIERKTGVPRKDW